MSKLALGYITNSSCNNKKIRLFGSSVGLTEFLYFKSQVCFIVNFYHKRGLEVYLWYLKDY